MGEKTFIIRCKAEATVSERWRVKASSAEEALERFHNDHESLEFEDNFAVDGEGDRSDFDVEELEPLPEGYDRQKMLAWLIADTSEALRGDTGYMHDFVKDYWKKLDDESLMQSFIDAGGSEAEMPE